MSKIVSGFLVIVTFIAGISIGMYYGVNSQDKEVIQEKKPIDSMQDVVIKNVQSKIEEDNEKNIKIEETVQKEERVSPYAKMTIEKKFSKCGHTTAKVLDVPKELVNLSKEEIEERYSGWDLKDFSTESFTLYRVIEANCDDHYVLKNDDGYIAVYSDLTDDIKNLIEKTDIEVGSLRMEDKEELEAGIKIYGKTELSSLIEDFSS